MITNDVNKLGLDYNITVRKFYEGHWLDTLNWDKVDIKIKT